MSATILGSVKDNVTGTLITTALVVAPPYTVTWNSGNYSFQTPGATTVTITASATNYVTQQKTVSVSNGQVKQVNFRLVPV